MNSIELNHICLVFLTDFVKQHKEVFEKDENGRMRFLKMNTTERIKLIDQTIDELEKYATKHNNK